MKKNVLTFGILLLSAQSIIHGQKVNYIGDKGYVKVAEGALVYSGLDLKTVGSGILDISGNVMVVGDTSSKIETLAPDGVSAKSNGGNIILRMNTSDNSRYGQLFIQGFNQDNITGIVDKEYRELKHGTYQQIAFPYYNKLLSSLNSELGKAFSEKRWSDNEILSWNNEKPRFDVVSLTNPIIKPTEYYAIGALGFNSADNPVKGIANPNVGTNAVVPGYTNGTYVVRGRPVGYGNATPNVQRLYGAGLGISYGDTGKTRNIYGEEYASYLQDSFITQSNPWLDSNYGKNLYQYGNPYFTNLDLSNIGITEAASIGDGMAIPNIQGIRFNPGTVKTDSDGATYSEGARVVTFTAGVPTGDVLQAMIKPMQTFVVKLSNSTNSAAYDLNFKNLRRFNYTPRAANVNYNVNAARGLASSSVKQLGVIALDGNQQEIGRTYFVVYADAKTGVPSKDMVTSQVAAGSLDIIGTYEEDSNLGGKDMSVQDKYWLYINEANEADFAKKAVAMELYSSDIKFLKFEILENAQPIADNEGMLESGKAFYIKKMNTTEYIKAEQNKIISVDGDQYSLFYDKNSAVLTTNDVKSTRTKIAFNPSIEKHILIFDPKWSTADVNVYDSSGKLILTKNKVKTNQNCEIEIPNISGLYVVTAVSDNGELFNGKVIR